MLGVFGAWFLYRLMVGRTTEKVLDFLGKNRHDRETWHQVKQMFTEEIFNFNSRNIAETYYNSVFRHSHKGLSVDEELMYVQALWYSVLGVFGAWF